MNKKDNGLIYTIGHSNKGTVELIDLLKKFGITRLIDVRSVPYSKYVPQFNREKISSKLQEVDIQYSFMGNFLGGRPKDPTCYKDNRYSEEKGDNSPILDYDKVAKRIWFKRHIDYLIKLSKRDRTAIMCSEENPNKCHRHNLVGKALFQEGIIVLHIRGDGSLEKAAFDLRATPNLKQMDLSRFE